MFKSKIVYALSLSFLVNVSHLPLAYAGRTEEDNPTHQKIRKVVVKASQEKGKQKKRKLKEVRKQFVAHNAEFPEPGTIWGTGSRDVWEVVGSHLPLDDYFRLFSCNRNFIALGEQLIQIRSLPCKLRSSPIILDVPFHLQGQYQGRKFSLSYLMRMDLSHHSFRNLRNLNSPDPVDELPNVVRRASFYSPIHPLMAAYYDVQARVASPLYSASECNEARRKFFEHLRDYARAQDPLALEMLIMSQLLSGTSKLHNSLFCTFPTAESAQKRVVQTITDQAFDQSHNPDYLLNLCRFVAKNENRARNNEPSNCSAWNVVGVPLLAYLEEEGVVVAPTIRLFKDRESAVTYSNTSKLFKAQLALLKHLANPEGTCPSMRVLQNLVNLMKFAIIKEGVSFHPAYVDNAEGYLHRLLSFGERKEEYQTYIGKKFLYVDGNPAMIAADDSVVHADEIKAYALENLLALHLQKGEDEKAKEIAKEITKDKAGASYFIVGDVSELLGRKRFALPYFRDAVLNGEDRALLPLWKCVTEVLNVDDETKAKVNSATHKVSVIAALGNLYNDVKKFDNALIYFKYGCQFDNRGLFENKISIIFFRQGNAEMYNKYVEAAGKKGHEQSLKYIENAKTHGMSCFEYIQMVRKKKKAEIT